MNSQPGNLAAKLARLFEEVRKPNGAKYTQKEVIEGTGGILTRVYLWKLRTGRADNPGFQVIRALADFFGVEVSYFAEDEASDSVQETAPIDLRYLGEIQARAAQMDEKARKAILDLMDYILSISKPEPPKTPSRGENLPDKSEPD
jgi:transcriptional regulator with XRE-family HTH domain